MSRRALGLWLGLAAILILVLVQRTLNSRTNREHIPTQTASAAAAERILSAAPAPASAGPPAGSALQGALLPEAVASGAPLNSAAAAADAALEFTNFPAATVLENMRAAVRAYAARFNGNPVGTNPEIAAALNGGNPGQVKFLRAEDGLRLNERGELVDPWGTPYFFHQLSAKEMEIHCAGPDKVMWTADDLVSR